MDKVKLFYIITGMGIAGAIYFLFKYMKERKELPPSGDLGEIIDFYRQEPLVGLGDRYWKSV